MARHFFSLISLSRSPQSLATFWCFSSCFSVPFLSAINAASHAIIDDCRMGHLHEARLNGCDRRASKDLALAMCNQTLEVIFHLHWRPGSLLLACTHVPPFLRRSCWMVSRVDRLCGQLNYAGSSRRGYWCFLLSWFAMLHLLDPSMAFPLCMYIRRPVAPLARPRE
jgi:hypothetical protein